MGTPQRPRLMRYEAWPTRMFGTYIIWAIYEDGSRRQVGHGTPAYCIAEAARRNCLIEEPGSKKPGSTSS